jgi:hypothetical protein
MDLPRSMSHYKLLTQGNCGNESVAISEGQLHRLTLQMNRSQFDLHRFIVSICVNLPLMFQVLLGFESFEGAEGKYQFSESFSARGWIHRTAPCLSTSDLQLKSHVGPRALYVIFTDLADADLSREASRFRVSYPRQGISGATKRSSQA